MTNRTLLGSGSQRCVCACYVDSVNCAGDTCPLICIAQLCMRAHDYNKSSSRRSRIDISSVLEYRLAALFKL